MRASRPSKKKVRILIADQEGVFRFGIKKLFGVEDDLRVVAQAETVEQAKAATAAFKPDLVYLQADLVEQAPGDLVALLRRLCPKTKVIITGSAMRNDQVLRYVKSGVAGLVSKIDPPEAFVKSARKVMNKEMWPDKRQFAAALDDAQPDPMLPMRPVETLTHREKTVLAYLTQGCRNRDIAHYLSITEQTVKNHLRAIYDKVGVSDRLELVLYAIHQRLQLPHVNLAPVEGTG